MFRHISKKVIFRSDRLDFFFFFIFFFLFIKQLKQNFLIFQHFKTGSKSLIIMFNARTNKGQKIISLSVTWKSTSERGKSCSWMSHLLYKAGTLARYCFITTPDLFLTYSDRNILLKCSSIVNQRDVLFTQFIKN
jgi:hypothetical protein